MSENKLVAVVNGKEITQGDVLKFLNDLGPQVAMQFQSPDGIKRVIDELVNQELLYLEAVENKIEKDEEFQDILNQTKITLLKSYALGKLINEEEVTETEVEEFYNEHRDHYKKPETVVASHILVDNEEKAQEILKEIEEGLSFEEAASKYSSCPSKEQGGNLGEFGKGQMVPEFEAKAFEMEIDTISEPVKTQFGYHIIKLNGKNPSRVRDLEEVKDEIYQQALRLKQQEKYLDKINELKGKYEVKIVE
ncbi:peptidyl-prolyl cis-trans isomerase [Wansuia hejianensis]|uniref:Peptidyl-prolyl cis-trans isomerase n=1 Tax=Wansuia hejianensis TaxID=2763667 RepID=A0A926EWG9_9FIRM|nr:peptidyl-prolyl cis-trans isomerase [Wansuia hejianensis]MBC8589598.1 peptidyl-prolyl cis-trans isomerase [Wansuia hejianensis]